MENKKFNYKAIYTIYIIVLIIILAYTIGWYIVGKKYKDYAIQKINNVSNISCEKISLNGFPFKFGLKFSDLKISNESYGANFSFLTKKMQLSKPLFDDIVKIEIDNIRYETNLSGNNKIIEVTLKEGSNLNLKFKDKKISSINATIPTMVISNSDEENEEIIIKNIVYRTEEIKNESYINKPNFLDIEKILVYEKNNEEKELKNESNISLDLSLIDIVEGEDILSNGLDLNKATYNDITNNYSMSLNGEYKSNSKTTFSLLFNIDINNYDNFISSLKEPIKIETAKNLFSAIPNINNNNDKDKHIVIKKAVDSDVITVNEKSLNDIMNDILRAI